MSSRKIGVLVSGRGSNLQSVLDRIADGYLPLEIAVVISDKADAYALERAEKAGIAAVAIPRKECVSKEEFEGKIDAALRAHGAELVVLAGFMRILSGNFVNKWTVQPAIFTPYSKACPWASRPGKLGKSAGWIFMIFCVHLLTKFPLNIRIKPAKTTSSAP